MCMLTIKLYAVDTHRGGAQRPLSALVLQVAWRQGPGAAVLISACSGEGFEAHTMSSAVLVHLIR